MATAVAAAAQKSSRIVSVQSSLPPCPTAVSAPVVRTTVREIREVRDRSPSPLPVQDFTFTAGVPYTVTPSAWKSFEEKVVQRLDQMWSMLRGNVAESLQQNDQLWSGLQELRMEVRKELEAAELQQRVSGLENLLSASSDRHTRLLEEQRTAMSGFDARYEFQKTEISALESSLQGLIRSEVRNLQEGQKRCTDEMTLLKDAYTHHSGKLGDIQTSVTDTWAHHCKDIETRVLTFRERVDACEARGDAFQTRQAEHDRLLSDCAMRETATTERVTGIERLLTERVRGLEKLLEDVAQKHASLERLCVDTTQKQNALRDVSSQHAASIQLATDSSIVTRSRVDEMSQSLKETYDGHFAQLARLSGQQDQLRSTALDRLDAVEAQLAQTNTRCVSTAQAHTTLSRETDARLQESEERWLRRLTEVEQAWAQRVDEIERGWARRTSEVEASLVVRVGDIEKLVRDTKTSEELAMVHSRLGEIYSQRTAEVSRAPAIDDAHNELALSQLSARVDTVERGLTDVERRVQGRVASLSQETRTLRTALNAQQRVQEDDVIEVAKATCAARCASSLIVEAAVPTSRAEEGAAGGGSRGRPTDSKTLMSSVGPCGMSAGRLSQQKLDDRW